MFDGASLDIFLRELTQAYAAPGAHLEAEAFSFLDAAQEEQDNKGGAAYLAAKGFFDAMLRSAEGATAIPYDFKDEGAGGRLERVSVTLDKGEPAAP